MQRVVALHSWINALPVDIRNAVVGRMTPRHYDDQEAVYSLGEKGHELFMIRFGKVRFCNYSVSGKEIQIAEVRTGDCFGELSLIDGLCRATYAYAVGPTDLLALQQQVFEQLYVEHPVIPWEINKLLSHRLRVAYAAIEDASVLLMKDRLARLLARLSYSVGGADEQGVTVLEGFTHEYLARMLGSTRQGISRELKLLEDTGLIKRSYSKIHIPDITALLDCCDGLVGAELIVPDYQ